MPEKYSKSIRITCNEETKSVVEWSKLSGVGYVTILSRIERGWTPEDAIFSPVDESVKGNGREMHGLCNLYPNEYRVWTGMICRCYNNHRVRFKNHGGRGIAVCDEWRISFSAFFRDMGARPTDKHQIERKDNDGPYCKENCIWATAKQQARNRRSNHVVHAFGQSKTIAEWAEEYGIPPSTLYRRLVPLKWNAETAISTPVRPHKVYKRNGN